MTLTTISKNRCFGGYQEVHQHRSATLSCDMRFGIYLPSNTNNERLPVLYYLSGLTCTEQNMITKGGPQRYCEQYGVVLVCPDTSPRGAGVADHESSDLGQGASFYLNATQAPWATNYRMYDYLSDELPALITSSFPVNADSSIFGHSMGGHGALVLSLSQPGKYRSVSAFAPVSSATQCPWGKKALRTYLGVDDLDAWNRYDAAWLLEHYTGPAADILVDQGLEDPFLDEQLKPDLLEAAASKSGQRLQVRRHAGYDHSYYFIASFVGDHVAHHAAALYR